MAHGGALEMTDPGIDRRAAMRRLALAGIAGGGLAAAPRILKARGASSSSSSEISVDLRLDESVGTINPAIYGQFAEHIGGVIYDGIWVGRESKIANTDGIRQTIIDHVKNLGPVVVRWPGGCFADRYHWRDGIGPPSKRPRRFGRWKEVTESNRFGTHEFIRFCRLCGVEPYLAANVGSGSPEEFQQWVEYCNAPAGSTTLADERAANGNPEPFGVKYWGVGNESWGCGGKFIPEDYCREYRRFTEWVPQYGVPLFLIAAGPNSNDLDWTKRFFARWADGARAPIDGWAPHYYCGTTGHALEFRDDQWYEQLDKASRMETLIKDQWAAMGEFDRKHAIKLIVDEWGSWHPAGTEINPRHLFEQMGTLRDALVAAISLDTFNRHADKVRMANIAQLVNNLHSLFLADGDRFVATPTYHVYTMYKAHQNARAVRIDVQAPGVAYRKPRSSRGEQIVRLAGSASRRDKDRVTLTLAHLHASEPATVVIRLRGGSAGEVRHTVLTHAELNAHNTFERPDVVKPSTSVLDVHGTELRCTLPAASVNALEIRLS
jgi:alpha-L-arabinofuranosidase